MIELSPARPARRVVALAAHCDDIAIGCGGTLVALAEAGVEKLHVLVMTGAGTARDAEERQALAALCGDGVTLDVEVLGLPDGRVPGSFDEAKSAMMRLRERAGDVDLVLAPQRHDAHQDHRAVAEMAPQVFRNHLVLGYEILKWESDLPPVTHYQPLPDDMLQRKLDILMTAYPSQQEKDWFDVETFTSLARIRGVQCHERYAEAFVVEKLTLALGGH